MYRPATGPSTVALRQLKARQTFEAAWALFGDRDRALLVLVVVRHISVGRAAEMLALRKPLATETLVNALDRLAGHFGLDEDHRRAA
jgi:hypothetical protein